MHFYVDISEPFYLKKHIQEAAQELIATIETIDGIAPEDIDSVKAEELLAKRSVVFRLDIKAGTRHDAQDIARAIVEKFDEIEPDDCDPEPDPEEEEFTSDQEEEMNPELYPKIHPADCY